MSKEKKDCLGCWYFLPFKNYLLDEKSNDRSIVIQESGYCLNERSKYYCDKVVGKGIVCKFWRKTGPKEEDIT